MGDLLQLKYSRLKPPKFTEQEIELIEVRPHSTFISHKNLNEFLLTNLGIYTSQVKYIKKVSPYLQFCSSSTRFTFSYKNPAIYQIFSQEFTQGIFVANLAGWEGGCIGGGGRGW